MPALKTTFMAFPKFLVRPQNTPFTFPREHMKKLNILENYPLNLLIKHKTL